MFLIRSIQEVLPKFWEKFAFDVVLDLAGEGFKVEFGSKVSVESLEVHVYLDKKTDVWKSQIEELWKIPDSSLGCVSSKLENRQEKISAYEEYVLAQHNRIESGIRIPREEFQSYRDVRRVMAALKYSWNPCDECALSTTCDKKFLATYRYPKVKIDGQSSSYTWILAMNVAAAVSRMLHAKNSKKYPLSEDKWAGIRKCSDCTYCSFVKRGTDDSCVDPVTGTAVYDEDETEMERVPSLMESRNGRDMRKKSSSLRCQFKVGQVLIEGGEFVDGSLVDDDDSCANYIWRSILRRKCNWVPASNAAVFDGSSIVAGTVVLNGAKEEAVNA